MRSSEMARTEERGGCGRENKMSVQCHANKKVSAGPFAAEDGSQTENTNDPQNALRPRPGLRASPCASPPFARERHTSSTWTRRRCEARLCRTGTHQLSNLRGVFALLGVGLAFGGHGLVALLLLLLLLLLLSVHERLQLLLEGAQLFVTLTLDLVGACPRVLQLLLSRGLILELLGARLRRVGRPLQGGVLARDEGSQVGLSGAVLLG